ncbi:hypothetical protein CN97_00825 [Haematobacter massiliensis]|uniref:DUF551 domain-containing protein n=1 Tax=Haematobacter massiliensis TaxID=195105 RepID=A0A086Y0J0_9RHOB|nr:hypothetical protein [Haematobacter massiliensis]KFI27790.1 hypothetical protein CN97_00825 [Haematobacter massiliensis]OWJ82726.1 hypothetical protein CDV51_17105 [Haematobacter massiliensis]
MTDIIEISNAMLERRIAQARQEGMPKWQPIATAPRDGTWVVVWFGFSTDDARPIVVRWSPGRCDLYPWLGDDGRYAHRCTMAWMPIPAPPSQDSKEGA